MLDDREKARLLLDLRSQARVTWANFEKMSERRAFLEWLRKHAPQPVVPLSFLSDDDPWKRIVSASQTAGTVVVSGDELLWGGARDRWRQALNLGRDAISDLRAPVVIIADSSLLDEIAQRAPDLWSWRGAVLEGDFQPWDIKPPAPGRADNVMSEPAWATIRSRPDLYVLPKQGTPFRTLLDALSEDIPAPGRQISAVRGAGGYSLLLALAEATRARFVPLFVPSGVMLDDSKSAFILTALGNLSRSEEAGETIVEDARALGRDLALLLGTQYADLARRMFEGRTVPYAAHQRLEARLRAPEVEGVVLRVFERCVTAIRSARKDVLLLAYARDFDSHRFRRVLEHIPPLSLRVVAVTSRLQQLPQAQPRLDARLEDAVADEVVARRFPWLPTPLRLRVVRWSDGLPGISMNILQYLISRTRGDSRVLTRAEVDEAAAAVAQNLSAGPSHESVISYDRETGLVGSAIESFAEEGFIRFPGDGSAPYFHPLWLMALGRSPDPNGPRALVPPSVFEPPSQDDAKRDLFRLRR